MSIPTDSGSLRDRTLLLVAQVPRTIRDRDIALKADVSHVWLSKFINGKISDPGIGNVQKLHDALVLLLGE